MLHVFAIILFMVLAGITFVLIYNLSSNARSKLGIAIAVLASMIISFPTTKAIVTFADSQFNPVPIIFLEKSHIKLTDKETTGTVNGETLPYATVSLLKSNKVILTIDADADGKFEIKKLHSNSNYQVLSSKNGKTSSKYDISIGKISNRAVTKLIFSNNSSSYEAKAEKDNRVSVSGTATPKSQIEIKSDNGKILDKITVDKTGEWSVEVDGPGTSNDDPDKIKYEFVGKFGKLKKNSGNYLTVTKFKENKTETPKNEVEAPKVEISAASAPKTTSVPGEYLAALNKARDYLSFSNMSKSGLYDQLVSEYGEKFPADAAQYAVDNLQADWNLIALKSAKDYRNDQNLSTSEIYDQLISEYGEKFTPSEANYAIQHLND